MPLTISNKINRSILNVKVEGKSESYYSDNFFIAIKEIFYDVLPMMRKIKSSSFLQLGGQSIDAVQIVYRINRKFNVNLRLCDFFQLDSIDSISNFISTLDKVNQTDIYSNARNHVDGKGIPLLGSQKRFIDWILKYHRNDSSKFLFTCIFELSGELNSKKLIDAIVRTVVNNFALNTRLKEDLSGLEEITDKEFDVRYVDLQNNCIDGVINELGTEFIDVFKERPIKFYLIKENGEKHYLIMRNHIVCSDGTTKVNILSAISSFYNNSDFSLNCRYKDYVSEEISHRPEWPKLLNYWKSLTANISKPELKKLPLNIPECVDTGVLTHVFSESAISMVNCLCGDLKVSISSVILHAIEAALSKIEELTLSYIIISNAKRFSPESKSVVGCLTDSYIYPLNYNESKSIKEVHRKNLELIENSQPSFQYITSSLLNEIDFCISSECPIIYSPQPIFGDSINLNNIELYELTGKPMWIWPIEIYPNISNSSIVININYAKCPDAEFIASRVFSHIKATFN
jgi:acyl carrier protein